MLDQVTTRDKAGGELDRKGFYGGLDVYSKLMLVAYVLLFVVAYVPYAMNQDITIFGLPWLFVMFPVGMVVYTGVYLVLTYYLDLSVKQESKTHERAEGD